MSTPVKEYVIPNDDSVSISSTGKCKSLAGIKYNTFVVCTVVAVISPSRLTVRFKNPYDNNKESTRSFNQEGHCLSVGHTRPCLVYLKAPGVASKVPLIVGARYS